MPVILKFRLDDTQSAELNKAAAGEGYTSLSGWALPILIREARASNIRRALEAAKLARAARLLGTAPAGSPDKVAIAEAKEKARAARQAMALAAKAREAGAKEEARAARQTAALEAKAREAEVRGDARVARQAMALEARAEDAKAREDAHAVRQAAALVAKEKARAAALLLPKPRRESMKERELREKYDTRRNMLVAHANAHPRFGRVPQHPAVARHIEFARVHMNPGESEKIEWMQIDPISHLFGWAKERRYWFGPDKDNLLGLTPEQWDAMLAEVGFDWTFPEHWPAHEGDGPLILDYYEEETRVNAQCHVEYLRARARGEAPRFRKPYDLGPMLTRWLGDWRRTGIDFVDTQRSPFLGWNVIFGWMSGINPEMAARLGPDIPSAGDDGEDDAIELVPT